MKKNLFLITLSMGIFYLGFYCFWNLGKASGLSLGGRIPVTDAGSYFSSMITFSQKKEFNKIASMRPFLLNFNSWFFCISGNNYLWFLVSRCVFLGLVVGLLACSFKSNDKDFNSYHFILINFYKR